MTGSNDFLFVYFRVPILGMHTTNDRQRARSLSSVPDLQASHNNHEAMSIPPNAVGTQSGSHEDNASVNAIALGRFTATSLPSHIWSWNGKFSINFLLVILFAQ